MANPIIPGIPQTEQDLLYSKLNAYNQGRASYKEVGAYLVVLPRPEHLQYTLWIYSPLPGRQSIFYICDLSTDIHETLRMASTLCFYSPRSLLLVEYNAKRMQSKGDDIISVGKYHGHFLHEILRIDPAYLTWIAFKFQPRIPKQERFVQIAKIYHSVHLDIQRRKTYQTTGGRFLGKEELEKEEAKQETPAQQNSEEKKPQVVDLDSQKEENETEGSVANATVTPTEPIATTTPSATPSFLEMKRKQRAEKAERERMEMEAAAAASEHVGMDISVALGEEKATSNTVSNAEVLNTPINPKEPFTKYKYPTLNLLKKYDDQEVSIDEEEQKANKNRIIEVLNNFGVQIKTIRATVGPTITLYEIQPAEGVRISKIKNLEDDIALSLAALGIRIIAPIPGKGTIGIEVPNAKANIVSMESILNSKKFQETKMELPIALGKTITNEVFMVDLAKIPHLLVAGATGQGKSVGLNAIITSLLYKKHPNELKLVLIDPKKVEFSVYSRITNKFMAAVPDEEEPIITDVTKVVRTLNSLCVLMDSRYDLLKKAGARNIKEYNQKYVNHRLKLTDGHEFMPYIVVIIDEFGDLIMTAGKEVELPIARIAQLARAVGIHMIIATQRPTTSIITGNIKANFPGRIAFKVTSAIDSKTILDRTGANQLIGRGDMLYLNGNEPVRVQCAFVDTPEIERINEYICNQPGPIEPMELPEPASEDGGIGGNGSVDARNLDPYFEEAAHAIVLSQQGSTSMIQRRFSIGYNRAGRLMDQLEAAGIVGAAQGSKPREVLLQDENQLNTLLMQLRNS